MSSIRTTNFLLAIIAFCLALIAGRSVLWEVLPSANAQTTAPWQRTAVYGCKRTTAGGCDWVPVSVDEHGVAWTRTK